MARATNLLCCITSFPRHIPEKSVQTGFGFSIFGSSALIGRQTKFETCKSISFRDIQNQTVIIRPACDSFRTQYLPTGLSH